MWKSGRAPPEYFVPNLDEFTNMNDFKAEAASMKYSSSQTVHPLQAARRMKVAISSSGRADCVIKLHSAPYDCFDRSKFDH
jgi:hypothetical protein